MNTYLSPFEYLGIMVQGGNVLFFLINAIFLFFIMPKLQPKRNEATVAIHKSLGWLLLFYVINYSLWIVPELLQDTCGYYKIGRIYPDYNTFMEYMDLAILPLSMVFGSTVLLGKLPNKWIGMSIVVPYLLCASLDVNNVLPIKLYTIAYVATIILVIMQLAWYSYFIKKFDKKLLDNYSDIEHRSTKWVFWTLIPLLLLALLYIPLNILTDVDEWMVVYDFLTFVFLSGIVGCALSHKVDDIAMDLIKEQIEEMKTEEAEKKPEEVPVEVTPTANEQQAAETPETISEMVEQTIEENIKNDAQQQPEMKNAPADNSEKGNTSASLSSKFADFDEVVQKLEEEKFYLDTEVNIDWISRKLGTNRHYVSDYLNQVKHVTFYEYVNTLRLTYAEQLLKEGKEKMCDIGFISGFNSDHTFRRLFKEKYGCTPLQYQKCA